MWWLTFFTYNQPTTNMRCPDCNKFVSYDEPQCELNSVEVDGDTVTVDVTVQLNCSECGTTLKDTEITADADIEHVCKPESERDKDQTPDETFEEGDEQYEVEDDGYPTGEQRSETKDRNGKPIKNPRYAKTYYGFTLDSDIKCRKCGEVFPVSTEGEEQASAFNECC